jgi:hypothetical protein
MLSSSDSFARLLSLKDSSYSEDYNNGTSWITIYRSSNTSSLATLQNNSGTTATAVTPGQVYILSSEILSSGLSFYKDGSLAGQTASASSLNTTSGLLIGQKFITTSERWDGIIAEVIFTSSTLQANRERVEGYLAHKWGLTASLPSAHPYKSSPPGPVPTSTPTPTPTATPTVTETPTPAPQGSWLPTNLTSSLALWLDASDSSTITLNGTKVSQWRDKSGNVRHANQSDSALQPNYTSAGLNGKNVVTLSQDNLAVTSLVLTGTGWHAFAVASLSSSSNGFGRLLTLKISSNTNDFDNANSWVPIYRNSSSNAIAAIQSSGSTSTSAVTYNQSYIFSSEILSSGLNIYKNGVLSGTKGSATSLNTTSGLQIGQALGANGEKWDGLVAEVIFISSTLQSDREKVEGYLAHKWGLASYLAAGHPYKNSAP